MNNHQPSSGTLVVMQQYASHPEPDIAKWCAGNGGKVKYMHISAREPSSFLSKHKLLLQWAKAFIKWMPQPLSFRNRKIYCTTAQIPFMLLCRLCGWCWGDYHVYFHNFYLHELGQKPSVKKILKFLLNNPRLTIMAQSEGEIAYYKALSDKVRLAFIPFCSDFTPVRGQLPKGMKLPESYIFTGGYTNRDYRLMFQLAERLPQQQFVFVASSLNGLSIPGNVKNVTLLTDLPKEQFESLLAASMMVIVPLKEDVGASGQMLSLSAIRNGKPTVYADLSVINYFFADKAGAPYRIADIESLTSAVTNLLSNPELMAETGAKAKRNGGNFTPDKQLPLIRDLMEL